MSSVVYGETEGSDYLAFLYDEDVDPYRTVPNNFMKVYYYLGTEAIRMQHILEFMDVIENTSYISNRHIVLLADVMTSKSGITPLNQVGGGLISKATKGEAMSNLKKDSTFRNIESTERGKLTSTFAVAVGAPVPGGTAETGLVIDDSVEPMHGAKGVPPDMNEDEIDELVASIMESREGVGLPDEYVPSLKKNQVYAGMSLPDIPLPVIVEENVKVGRPETKWRVDDSPLFRQAVSVINTVLPTNSIENAPVAPSKLSEDIPNLPLPGPITNVDFSGFTSLVRPTYFNPVPPPLHPGDPNWGFKPRFSQL